MAVWKVTGKIAVMEFCSCEHCEGHNTTEDFETMVMAADEDEAIKKAFSEFCRKNPHAEGWKGEPEAYELPTDMVMAHLGCATLPGLEKEAP